jgi:hypothetical protein
MLYSKRGIHFRFFIFGYIDAELKRHLGSPEIVKRTTQELQKKKGIDELPF